MAWDKPNVVAGKLTVLACAALSCGFVSSTMALVVLQLSLPPTDGAYGQPLSSIWSDPFVRMIAVPASFIGAGIWFLLSLPTLWNTRLSHSIPLVFIVTVLAAGISGPLGPLSPVSALAAAVGAMLICHWKMRVPMKGGCCEACGYDLRGSRSDTCPECGQVIPEYIRQVRDGVGI